MTGLAEPPVAGRAGPDPDAGHPESISSRRPDPPARRCGPHRTGSGPDLPGEARPAWDPGCRRCRPAEPQLSTRAVTGFGIIAVTLIIAVAAAVAVMIGAAATRPSGPAADGLYLGSVRENSVAEPARDGDDELVETGRAVCVALDAPADVTACSGP